MAGDPPGHLPDGRRGRQEHGSGERGAQRVQVAAHRPAAAAVTLSLDLGVQLDRIGAALVPPFVQVRAETVDAAGGWPGPGGYLLRVAARMNLRTVLGDRPSIAQIWV